MPEWEDFVSVALDELLPHKGSSVHVRNRLRRLLEELIEQAPPGRRGVLERRLTCIRGEDLLATHVSPAPAWCCGVVAPRSRRSPARNEVMTKR